MSNDKDPETTQMEGEAEALEAMFGSSGWAIAEKELHSVIDALRDISTIDDNDPNIGMNVQVRKKTALALEEWVNILKSQVNNVIISKEGVRTSKLVERRD